MLAEFREAWKKKVSRIKSFVIAKLLLALLYLLVKSCRIHVHGIEAFTKTAEMRGGLLILWHNRLAPVLFILNRFTPHIHYAAVVSGSRDGEVLSKMICSYEKGSTIRVPHLARYQALRTLIDKVKEGKQVVVITPDGPRGPLYEMKPGVAIAALETGAPVVALDWTTDRYWELKTWDRFRIPKPFATLHITFGSPVQFGEGSTPNLEEAKKLLKSSLEAVNKTG